MFFMVKQRNLDKDGRVNLIKIINTSHSKFYQIIRVILLSLILLIQSLAEEKKKLLPLKELISREGFWADTGSIKYFCMRCSGLYFFTVTASDINKPLDKGDLKKIKKRAEDRKVYLRWAFKMWEAASLFNDGKEKRAEDYVDILNLAKIYAENSEESKLTCGNLDYKDDLNTCILFIENTLKATNKTDKNSSNRKRFQ